MRYINHYLFFVLIFNSQQCFCLSTYWTSFDGLTTKEKAREIEQGGVNQDQLDINLDNFDPLLPYDTYIPSTENGVMPEYRLTTPDDLANITELKGIHTVSKILGKTSKNKTEQYKKNRTIPAYINYVIPSLPLPLSNNSSQKSILIDNFSFEIKKNESYGNNIFINTFYGKHSVEAIKTPNCIIETYRVEDALSIDHHTLSYKPQQKEQGKLAYTLTKPLNILYEFSQPILQLKFSGIAAPFNIDFSLTDDLGTSQYYPKINCSPEHLVANINLLNPNENHIDFTKLKTFSFTFQASEVEAGPVFHLDSIEIVPEPLSILTLLTGFVSSIKINKSKNVIKK